MPPAKSNWRKLIYRLSPVLIVSLGLHALALLIPVPDKDIAKEPDVELPEPISVTELPKSAKPTPAPPPAAEPAFVLPPEPPPEPVVQPLPPEPPAQMEPAPIAPPEPSIAPEPAIDPDPLSPDPTPDPAPDPTPEPTPEPTLQTPAPISQARSMEGTSDTDFTNKLKELIELYSIDPSNPVAFKSFRSSLDLTFPADDYCLKDEGDAVATTAQSFLSVLIERDEAGDSFDVVDGEALTLTGYSVVDKWIDKTAFPSDMVDPNEVEAIKTPKPASLDIFDWMTNNYGQSLLEDGEDAILFSIGVEVTFANNCE